MSEYAQIRTEFGNGAETVSCLPLFDAVRIMAGGIQFEGDVSDGIAARRSNSSNISEAITASGKLKLVELEIVED